VHNETLWHEAVGTASATVNLAVVCASYLPSGQPADFTRRQVHLCSRACHLLRARMEGAAMMLSGDLSPNSPRLFWSLPRSKNGIGSPGLPMGGERAEDNAAPETLGGSLSRRVCALVADQIARNSGHGYSQPQRPDWIAISELRVCRYHGRSPGTTIKRRVLFMFHNAKP